MEYFVPEEVNDVSGNEITFLQIEKLDSIKESLDDLALSLGVSDRSLSLTSLQNNTSIDGYYVRTGRNELCYIPVDRIQYLSKTSSGQLINLSSSTIYCYSLDSNGNRGTYYRFQPFGTLEYQYNDGYYTQWAYTSAAFSDSNLTIGQTGLHSFTELALFLILFVMLISFFFRRR